MFSKSIVLSAAFVLLSPTAFSHDSDPAGEPSAVEAAMRYCQTVGARAAWGAQARFLGAPATFKYVAQTPLRKIFMGEVSDIPTDGIYVLDEMDLTQRREYEEVAFYGWKQADKWMHEGKERPEYMVLTALFYDGCKQELTARASAHEHD
jgi:hypothetical protein